LTELLKKVGLYNLAEDCSITPVPNTNLLLLQNIDIFTPIIDEPEIMGEIAACNVTNDVFAMNVPEITGMLVFLAMDTLMPMKIAEGIMNGIKNFMKKINSKVTGGHTIYCEWPLIGGEASGFVEKDKLIRKQGLKKGDRLIITKPTGLQPVMAAYRILKDTPEILENYSNIELKKSINYAIELMTTSNQNVVETIYSYDDFSFIHAMTDVTGFGLAGHTKEMLEETNLSAIIDKVPVIKYAKSLSEDLYYHLDTCEASETAGGMLIAIDANNVEEFSNRLKSNNIPNWCVGLIDKKEPGSVILSKNIEFEEVSKK
jgi:selenide,water dikinase